MLHKFDNGQLVQTCTVCGQTTRCCQAFCPGEKSTTPLIEAVNAAQQRSDCGRSLILNIAYALKIDKLCDSLANFLSRFSA